MAEPGQFARVDQAVLTGEDALDLQPWAEGYERRHATKIEAYYCGRLVRALNALNLGPVDVCPANHPFDLVIAGHSCELKVARARERTTGNGFRALEIYQGTVKAANGRKLNGEVVILLCVDYGDRLWPYVVPALWVGNRSTIEITSHPTKYAGQWAPFLEAFEYVAPA